MSTTVTPPPAAAAPPAPPAQPAANATERSGSRGADTPTRLRLVAIVVSVVAAGAGVAGSVALAARTTQLGAARDAAAQLERLESVRTAVVEADSLATAAYLAGGLEPPTRRAAYESTLADAQQGLVAAAAVATPEESERLGAAAAALGDVAGRVEQARANSRQGFPVGAAYQRSSSALLRSDVLPVLDEVADATSARVVDDVEDSSTPIVLGVGLLVTLVALGVASGWILRRTNRVLNPGLVATTVVLGGSLCAALWSLGGSSITAVDTIDREYAAATAAARARTAAFDAKSNEALTLIARGNGAAFEARWQELAAQASAYLDRAAGITGAADTGAAFTEYRDAHAGIRAADDGGDHAAAVAAALSVGDGDAFARFDDASAASLAALSSTVDGELSSAGDRLVLHRWLVLVAGLAGAGAAFAGIARRVQEYR